MNRRLWHLIPVRQIVAILSVVLGLFLAQPLARAQASFLPPSRPGSHHTRVQLLVAVDTVKPGDTIFAAVDLKMDPGWHTYWKNPGEAGMATKIEWTLPPGISAGAIQWPVPEKLPPLEVTTYAYENEALLLVPLSFATNVSPGSATLSAKVSWLECQDVCIPADTVVSGKVTIGSATQPSPDSALIQTWARRLPQTAPFPFQAGWGGLATNDTRPLVLSGGPAAPLNFEGVDFFPDAGEQFEVQPATDSLSAPAGFRLQKLVKKFSGDWPREISGLLVLTNHDQRLGFAVRSSISETPPAGRTVAAAADAAPGGVPPPLWQMLLYAVIGGLILNLMPCVLPVIALKILGFVSEAHSEPRRLRRLGFVYAFGVLLSFLVLAAVVIGVKAAGRHAGWGMQFSSPVFVVCLTTLVLLVALNLFGVFQVALRGRALDAAGTLAARRGVSGAFFNGVLTTVLATPCTAPILADAVGFAFQQAASIIVLIFLAVGVGLALPYVALSCWPAGLRFLPKPGPWMEKFKIAMGFPMLATVVWLFNLAAGNYGKNVLWLGLFLVLVSFAAWFFGEFVQRGRRHQLAAALVAGLVLAAAYAFALEKQLHWRVAVPPADGAGESARSPASLDWQPWSPEAVAAARAAGHPVLVDFTADWCLTCQVNRKTSIEIPSVRARLQSLHAVAFVGDDTRSPDAIFNELQRYQRAGVPLVLVFPPQAGAPAIVLPALLTPGIVLSALDRAAGRQLSPP